MMEGRSEGVRECVSEGAEETDTESKRGREGEREKEKERERERDKERRCVKERAMHPDLGRVHADRLCNKRIAELGRYEVLELVDHALVGVARYLGAGELLLLNHDNWVVLTVGLVADLFGELDHRITDELRRERLLHVQLVERPP